MDAFSKYIGEKNAKEFEKIINSKPIYAVLFVIAIIVFLLIIYGIPYGICILFYSKMVTKKILFPVNNITNAMIEVSKGNKNVKLDFNTEYEFIKIRDPFNYMVNEIAKLDQIQKEYEEQRNILLSGMAHDLKNPIMTISGYSRALIDNVFKYNL